MSRMLRLGYRRKPHPVAYVGDEDECVVPVESAIPPVSSSGLAFELPAVPISSPDCPSLPQQNSSVVQEGLDFMQQLLDTSLSPGTITQYQVCNMLYTIL